VATLSWLSTTADGVRIQIRVQPRASRTEIVGLQGDALKIRLASPPVDGAANRELVAFLAKRLRRPKSSVRIERGQNGRRKSIHVNGLEESAVRAALGDPT